MPEQILEMPRLDPRSFLVDGHLLLVVGIGGCRLLRLGDYELIFSLSAGIVWLL